jgi:hypothetical protein
LTEAGQERSSPRAIVRSSGASAARVRTAKPCRSGSRCWCQVRGGSSARPGRQTLNPRMTVARRIRRRGERGISRKTIARGMPGLLRCDRGDYARVLCFISHARLRVHWAFPAPSVDRGANGFCKTSGASRRGNACSCLKLGSRHCEPTGRANALPMTGSAKQSISPRKEKNGLLRRFAPRNDGS